MEIQWNILIIDRNANTRQTLADSLRNQYAVYTASSEVEGLKILHEKDIHLAILDQTIGAGAAESIIKTHPETLKAISGPSDDIAFLIRAINAGNVHTYIPKPWDAKTLHNIIESALDVCADNQAKAHLVRELEQIIEEMRFLYKISQTLSEKKSLPRLLSNIMESSKLLMNAEASSLLLYDKGDRKLHFQVATGAKGKLVKKFSIKLGTGIAGWVGKHKKSLLIPDCYADSRFNPDYDKRSNFKTRSMICVPLMRKNRLLGVIQVINKKDGSPFEERDLRLFETLASQCAIAIENHQLIEKQIESEALERELDMAREIQEKLLPEKLPDYTDIEIAAKLIPAKQVGGDYYNILRVDDNHSLFFVADVTGKGIPAALIVSTLCSSLSSYLKLKNCEFDLMTLVKGMNLVLIESTTVTRFATAWFGLYHHDTKILTSVNCGHNPPYLYRRGVKEPVTLDAGGLFLGGLDMPYESEQIQLGKGDAVIFFSDGVTEAWDKKEEEYGEERLISLVADCAQCSAGDILTKIEKDVKIHVGGAKQSDDFTCAVLKVL